MSAVKCNGTDLVKVMKILNECCKPYLADKWDNVGLLVEPSPPFRVNHIVVTNDLTEAVLDTVINVGGNFVLAYHPPIFSPLKRLTQAHWKGRVLIRCIEKRIAVFSPHTGLDAMNFGVNDWLLSCFELESIRPLLPCPWKMENECRLLVRPNEHFARFALTTPASVAALDIQSSEGKVSEVVCLNEQLGHVCDRLSSFGMSSLTDTIYTMPSDKTEGYGRIGCLKRPMCFDEVCVAYKKLLNCSDLIVSVSPRRKPNHAVNAIAVCAGSGGSVLFRNALALTADVFVTGELPHHDRLEANARGISLIITGHSVSERGYLVNRLIPKLSEELKPLDVTMAVNDEEPGQFINNSV